MKSVLLSWLPLLVAQAFGTVDVLLKDAYIDEASFISVSNSFISPFSDSFGSSSFADHVPDLSKLILNRQRPDLKPVIPNITIYHPDLVSPGSWFYAPFMRPVTGSSKELPVYIPRQYGPHIYDGHGVRHINRICQQEKRTKIWLTERVELQDLIWSGASLFNGRNVFDFRKTRYKNSDALSLLVAVGESVIPSTETIGVILNSSYDVVKTVMASNGQGYSDMHEFNVIEDGNSALLIATRWQNVSGSLFNKEKTPATNITKLLDFGFQEVDVETGRMKFEWWAFDHIPASDTHWQGLGDIYHMNSVDKTSQGDYLVSVRHTSTVYLVSSKDGSIIWQLGGPHSSFVHTDNFTFSSQHDARVHSQNKTHMVVSLLNNAADDVEVTANCSSALLVLLSTATSPMTATILRQWDRPDGQLTDRRGNVQLLHNSNVVVGWAGYGYVSEFTFDGTLVQEARSRLERFEEYRQYKFEWTAAERITEPIALASHMYGTTADTWTTVLHVSWNGATEVAAWNFYSSTKAAMAEYPSLIASTRKQGFETGAVVSGYYPFVFVEAVAGDGTSLQNSTIETTKLPPLYVYDQRQIIQSAVIVPSYTGLISVDHSMLFPSWLLLLLITVPSGLVICVFLCLRRSLGAGQTRGYGSKIAMEDLDIASLSQGDEYRAVTQQELV
ncbi:hypothetical protein CDV55_105348 [Aspergillus turcosus]|nr:hypothetical protein CDV55_105348 [Aspergillus turcosus]